MDKQALILIVEDNEELSCLNSRALTLAGHRVLAAHTLAQARAHLLACAPDVILLDVLLPDGDGIDFCAEIRDQTDAHILFLTSKTEHDDRVRGLTTGGDDYITKPYKLEEMLARVQAALRRRRMTSADTLARGPLMLDINAGRAYLRGVDLLLSRLQFALLLVLTQHLGRVVSKDVLYERAWAQPTGGDSNALWAQISRLKKQLEAAGGDTVVISAVRGEGYRLDIEDAV